MLSAKCVGSFHPKKLDTHLPIMNLFILSSELYKLFNVFRSLVDIVLFNMKYRIG